MLFVFSIKGLARISLPRQRNYKVPTPEKEKQQLEFSAVPKWKQAKVDRVTGTGED
jgi:hypothetical protein